MAVDKKLSLQLTSTLSISSFQSYMSDLYRYFEYSIDKNNLTKIVPHVIIFELELINF